MNVWQIRASLQGTPASPSLPKAEPTPIAQPIQRYEWAVSMLRLGNVIMSIHRPAAVEKPDRSSQQRTVWSNPNATRAIVAGKPASATTEPVPILHPSAFPALSDTMSISPPRSAGQPRRRAQQTAPEGIFTLLELV